MALFFYRVANRLYRWRIPALPKLFTQLGFIFFGSYLPPSCSIGRGTKMAYGGSGVVFHAQARVGENCLISPGVVLGGRGGHKEVPQIGDRVSLFPGCKVLGPITIGDDCMVAANAVVIESMPSGAIALGPVATIRVPNSSKLD